MTSNRMRNRSIVNNGTGVISGTSRGCHGKVRCRIPQGAIRRRSLLYYSVKNTAAAHARPVAIAPAATTLPAIMNRTVDGQLLHITLLSHKILMMSECPSTQSVLPELEDVFAFVAGIDGVGLAELNTVGEAVGAGMRVNIRIRLLPESAINMFPSASIATLRGLNSLADKACPLSPLYPCVPLPATVVMTPVLFVTIRMRRLSVSAM